MYGENFRKIERTKSTFAFLNEEMKAGERWYLRLCEPAHYFEHQLSACTLSIFYNIDLLEI